MQANIGGGDALSGRANRLANPAPARPPASKHSVRPPARSLARSPDDVRKRALDKCPPAGSVRAPPARQLCKL